MSHQIFSLAQAAAHIHLEANELKHVAQRGEIDATIRSGEWYFEHAALDEWAQRHFLASTKRHMEERHRAMIAHRQREKKGALGVEAFFLPEAIDLAIAAKAKAGIIRDMTDLADRIGLVYDPDTLFQEVCAREEAASTAVGEGAAFLHPRFHNPYIFQESFIAYGRSERTIFFGAPDGAGTRHFFLICSTNHEEHLHILALLAVLAHGSDLMERLDAAETPEDVMTAIHDCEAPYLQR